MNNLVFEAVKNRLASSARTRILAFGSSNTERYLYGMHWFDVVNLGIREKYGSGKSHFINTGISGNTTADLLDRFQDDAAFYKPRLVFITIGGNDCNPLKNISGRQFKENLEALHHKFSDMGTIVIFQTYYSPDPLQVDEERLGNFYSCMDTVREVAAATKSGLIDHLRRWEPLRLAHNDRYLKMMLNGFHVNQIGNALLGLDILRSLDVAPGAAIPGNPFPALDEAVENQKLMDSIGSEKN
ncbi:MAG: hypothetical protein A2020_06665 [Lentisphaerae bacterium GWF2_45_14]|nr:MAG: hypothetical protein A2020_06665 [Lentisphaerae bacterium GWF2_45_14]